MARPSPLYSDPTSLGWTQASHLDFLSIFLFLLPLSSLISNCLNLLSGTWGSQPRSEDRTWSEGRPREALQGPAHFQCPRLFLWPSLSCGEQGQRKGRNKVLDREVSREPAGEHGFKGDSVSVLRLDLQSLGGSVNSSAALSPSRVLARDPALIVSLLVHCTFFHLRFISWLPPLPAFPLHTNQLFWQSQNQPHHFILKKQDAPCGALKRISRGLFAEARVGQREAVVLRTHGHLGPGGRRERDNVTRV